MTNTLIEQKVKELDDTFLTRDGDYRPAYKVKDFIRQALLSLYNQGRVDALTSCG